MKILFTLIFLCISISQISHGERVIIKAENRLNTLHTIPNNENIYHNCLRLNYFYISSYDPAVVEIYPNPFTGKFMLNLKNFPVEKLTINIYDYIGNSVYSTIIDNKTSDNSYEVDVSKMQLKPGIFFLKIEARGLKTKVVRLIKQ